VVLLALVGGLVGSRLAGLAPVAVGSAPAITIGSSGGPATAEALSIADVAERVRPAVVSIRGAGSEAQGSGFVVSTAGYVVTNDHVVQRIGAERVRVAFPDGSSSAATVVGRSPSYDITVLRVSSGGGTALVLGDSALVLPGDTAVAIGSPLGLEGTVTAGIISAVNRPVVAGVVQGDAAYVSALQTDAPINPGNSGGPLVNSRAEVIGVTSADLSLDGSGGQSGSIGLGFAIPVNEVKRVVGEIIATGQSTTPIIGVSVDSRYGGDGALVESVTAGGPADSAGVEAGDVITGIDGDPVGDSAELIAGIRRHAPGERITVTVRTNGATREVQIVLAGQTGR